MLSEEANDDVHDLQGEPPRSTQAPTGDDINYDEDAGQQDYFIDN